MRPRKRSIRWLLAAFCIALGVASVVRALAPIELLELMVYDCATAGRAADLDQNSPVVQVVFTEKFLNGETIGGEHWPHPIPDAQLASILQRLLDAGAAVVGVDIWRGIPQPVGNDDETLAQLISSHENCSRLLWIFDPDSDSKIRAAPAAIAGDPGRAVLSDFVADAGMSPRFRRGLFLEGEDEYAFSLGMMAAQIYLGDAGITMEWGEDVFDAHKLGEAVIRGFEGTDGAYRNQDDGGIQTLLTFPHRSFPRKDFAWVMESSEAELRGFVEGKVVLVGVTADSIKDSSPTPIGENTRGLDVHAAFTTQIIGAAQGRWPMTVATISDRTEFLLLGAAALLGVLIGGFSRRILWAAISTLAIAVTLVAGGGWLVTNYIWVPVVSPSIALLLGFSAAAATAWKLERIWLNEISDVMLATLGEEQIDLIWGEREQLLKSGKIKAKPSYATLMMTDLRDFASLTEALGSERLLPWLDRYMQVMSATIKQHKGFVKAYIGDAIYAVFGLGEQGDAAREPARQAILCSLAMRQALGQLNAELREEGEPEIGMRVGINSGTVCEGTMGSAGAMEYAIMGDAVNVAARLESYDKGVAPDAICRIIAADSTVELAGAESFNAESIGELALKGKSTAVGANLIISAI